MVEYESTGFHGNRVMMGKNGVSTFLAVIHLIRFILAGHVMHECSDEFEFVFDWTTHCRVSCP